MKREIIHNLYWLTRRWLLNVRNSTFNSNSGDTPQLLHNSRAYFHRAVTLPFAPTHFTFVLDFRMLITSVSGWNLCFSSTLNFWIEYLSCNDDLVSKIRDHFPNLNCQLFEIAKLVKGFDFIIGPCRRSYYRVCTMFQVTLMWLTILINAEINNQLFY